MKFLLTYWIGIALFFGIFYWDASPISLPINSLQTDFTTFLTSLTLPREMMNSTYITITSHYSLVIEKACNGMIPYLFFLASIVAFPSTLLHKIKWAILGYLFIVTMNTFRIWMVTQLVLQEQNNFSLAHDYIGNGLLILTGLMLFVWFVKSRKKQHKTYYNQNILLMPLKVVDGYSN
jgi:exosortase/archaeosortase family protein